MQAEEEQRERREGERERQTGRERDPIRLLALESAELDTGLHLAVVT